MLEKTIIHGQNVKYEKEDKVENGIKYLRDDLQREEAMVFFDHAKSKGTSQFETDTEEQYTLSYSSDGSYILLRREESRGFF